MNGSHVKWNGFEMKWIWNEKKEAIEIENIFKRDWRFRQLFHFNGIFCVIVNVKYDLKWFIHSHLFQENGIQMCYLCMQAHQYLVFVSFFLFIQQASIISRELIKLWVLYRYISVTSVDCKVHYGDHKHSTDATSWELLSFCKMIRTVGFDILDTFLIWQ